MEKIDLNPEEYQRFIEWRSSKSFGKWRIFIQGTYYMSVGMKGRRCFVPIEIWHRYLRAKNKT